MNLLKSLFCVVTVLCYQQVAGQQYWVAGAAGNWSNAANWSATSGGAGGAGAPASWQDAIFDGNGTGNCTIDQNVDINNITVQAGYSGAISQGAFTININGTATFSGGTFSGGSGSITVDNDLTISGATFTSTSDTLNTFANVTLTSGSFIHNNGALRMSPIANSAISGVTPLYDLIHRQNYTTLTINSTITVANDLNVDAENANGSLDLAQNMLVQGNTYFSGDQVSYLNIDTLKVEGDVHLTNTQYNAGGSGTLSFVGTGNQDFYGTPTGADYQIPNVHIKCSNLTLHDIISVQYDWVYESGTFNAGTSTVIMNNFTGSTMELSGTHTFNNLQILGEWSTVNVSGDPDVAGSLLLDASAGNLAFDIASTFTALDTATIAGGNRLYINTGSLIIKDNLTITNTNGTAGGDGLVLIDGTVDQILTGPMATDQGFLPSLQINKSSGTLTILNNLSIRRNWTWTAGTVDATSSPTTVYFENNGVIQTITASGMIFDNVIISTSQWFRSRLGANMFIAGDFTIQNGSGFQTNNHNMEVGGDWTNNHNAVGSFYSGSGTVTFNGTGPATQTIFTNGRPFHNVVVNNTAGRTTYDDVTLDDEMLVSNSLDMQNGRILSTTNNHPTLEDGATANIGNATSYVNGPMEHDMALNGSRTLTFPVGVDSLWLYTTLDASHSSASSYTYRAEMTYSSASALGYSTPATITHVSHIRYLDLDRNITGGAASNANLSGNQTITMHYVPEDVVTDYMDLTIAKTDATGTNWVDIGGVATANSMGTVTSTSSPTAFTDFSLFALANKVSGSNPLPVELISFSVEPIGTSALLKWTTATEINNSHFVVERSQNGLDFDPIGTVSGAGNSTEVLNYNHIDHQPMPGISFYRLRQVDFDGQFDFSSIEPFNMGANGSLIVYPNPVLESVTIPMEGVRDIRVYDRTGRLVYQTTPNNFSVNLPTVQLTHLRSGVYELVVQTEHQMNSFTIYKE